MENTKEKPKQTFWQWLMEDDAPEIGFASKESLGDYLRGVKFEFKKIQWPSKEQVQNEFITVLVIVAIISALVYFMDLGFERVIANIREMQH